MIHVKKQHNKELRHIIESLSMVIKEFCCCINAHCCQELLETKVYVSSVMKPAIATITRPQGCTRHLTIGNIHEVRFF